MVLCTCQLDEATGVPQYLVIRYTGSVCEGVSG